MTTAITSPVAEDRTMASVRAFWQVLTIGTVFAVVAMVLAPEHFPRTQSLGIASLVVVPLSSLMSAGVLLLCARLVRMHIRYWSAYRGALGAALACNAVPAFGLYVGGSTGSEVLSIIAVLIADVAIEVMVYSSLIQRTGDGALIGAKSAALLVIVSTPVLGLLGTLGLFLRTSLFG